VHAKLGNVPYSLEAALLSTVQIRFCTGVDDFACDYEIFCECCDKNIYHGKKHYSAIHEAICSLPDSILCHKFLSTLGKEKIVQYLFDQNFDTNGISQCAEYISDRDNRNDCFIGNDQQILDALSNVNENHMIDILDAFFRLLPRPQKKTNYPSPEEICQPLDRMMRTKLYESLEQTLQTRLAQSWKARFVPENEKFDVQEYLLTDEDVNHDDLPSKLSISHESISKKVRPSIDFEYQLLENIKHITKVDWSKTEGFKNLPLLPSGDDFQILEGLIGEGKVLGPVFHFSGLLPYLMNLKTQTECPLQKKYSEYPQASWSHAFSCANQCRNKYSEAGRKEKCSPIIYIADSFLSISDCNEDFMRWVKNQPDIHVYDGYGTQKGKGYNFQFVLNEKMHSIFDPLPSDNNKRAKVEKGTKSKLQNAFGKYTKERTHRIRVLSTLPYVAIDSYNGDDQKLQLMDVMSYLSLVYGETDEFGIKRQLMSSSCFEKDKAYYAYEEGQEDESDSKEVIENEDGPNLRFKYEEEQSKSQQESKQQQNRSRGKVLRDVAESAKTSQVSTRSRGEGSIAISKSQQRSIGMKKQDRSRGKVLRNVAKIAKSSQVLTRSRGQGSIAISRQTRTATGKNREIGCRFESDRNIPETLPESISFMIEVSSQKWNCLLGNAINTIVALGHLPLISGPLGKNTVLTDALQTTSLPRTQRVNFATVLYCLLAHGYKTTISEKKSFDFSFLHNYANQSQTPMLVLLRMQYPQKIVKFHVIGIVPVRIDNEVHMHIVEGCHPNKKTIPLNEPNFTWCCGECDSYSVDQFVAFEPGKKAATKLQIFSKGLPIDHPKHMALQYDDKDTTKTELNSFETKKKRKRVGGLARKKQRTVKKGKDSTNSSI